MSDTVLALLCMFLAVACWFATGPQRWCSDLYRSGVLDSSQYPIAKSAGVGALAGAFICAMGTVTPLMGLAIVALSASMATLALVFMLTVVAGLDSQMADAMMNHYELAKAVLPAERLGNEHHLQAYLDRAYGRGRVSAKEMLTHQRTSAGRTTTDS